MTLVKHPKFKSYFIANITNFTILNTSQKLTSNQRSLKSVTRTFVYISLKNNSRVDSSTSIIWFSLKGKRKENMKINPAIKKSFFIVC